MRHVCFLETFNSRYVFDVGVTRLLRTCQTRFQCFQTPCVSLLGHHRTVMYSCRSCPGKLSSSHCSCQAALQLSAIFQRTSNPEVKAKAATHKTISVLNIILISLIIIVMTEVLDPEALAVACPEELSTADAAAFRFLPESGCLACHPAARRSWQANDFMTFVQSCFVTPRPH